MTASTPAAVRRYAGLARISHQHLRSKRPQPLARNPGFWSVASGLSLRTGAAADPQIPFSGPVPGGPACVSSDSCPARTPAVFIPSRPAHARCRMTCDPSVSPRIAGRAPEDRRLEPRTVSRGASRLRVLPLAVRRCRGQAGRGVLNAALRREDAGRDDRALPGPRLRSVLRLLRMQAQRLRADRRRELASATGAPSGAQMDRVRSQIAVSGGDSRFRATVQATRRRQHVKGRTEPSQSANAAAGTMIATGIRPVPPTV